MFSFLKRKLGGDRSLGVSFHQDGVSMALAAKNPQHEIVLEHLEYQSVSDTDDMPAALKKMVSKAGFKGIPTTFVMEPTHYSLMQVESPEVADDELKNAVRWRVKDLIDFHIDDAVIDIISLPSSKRVGAPKLMYVIATRTSFIESTVEQLESAGLSINAIDVAELSLRNMTFADTQENRANAFLYLSKNMSLIEICDNGSLCLSRHISINVDDLDESSTGNRSDMMDMLSLEVQRSLDYYESQYASGAASELNFVSQCSLSVDEFSEVAGSYLTVPIKNLSALEKIKGIDGYDADLVTSCLPTIGASIRDFAWTN